VSSNASVQNESFNIQQTSITTTQSQNTQSEVLYIQPLTSTTTSSSNAQNEAFYIQQESSTTQAQNEAFYIQSSAISLPSVQNEAFYIQPYLLLHSQTQNEAFFVQQLQTTVTHISIPEYIHFISIPQAYYNDISFSINVSTEIKLVKQYIFGISYNITISTQIKTTTVSTPSSVELEAIEVGVFLPALYFLGKKLYNKLVKRRRK